mmetsp:Transcript_107118/g.169260  ORF Transcript_107118/g.169260 Transcript_107118/m.169260 type:complete len:219 (+) Transcript_107118:75-731(+)
MAAALYHVKVKNTFLEVDADDDTLSSLSDEEEYFKRQVTEPAPSTTPLLGIPRSKFFEGIYCSENFEGSTTSSDHAEPFQPECEPELVPYANGRETPSPYEGEPLVLSLATTALVGRDELPAHASRQQPTKTPKQRSGKAKETGRRKRESLIDIAARKQKQQARQQQKRFQSGSSARSNPGTQEHAAKTPLANFCHHCGNACQPDFKFCRFCGSPIHA